MNKFKKILAAVTLLALPFLLITKLALAERTATQPFYLSNDTVWLSNDSNYVLGSYANKLKAIYVDSLNASTTNITTLTFASVGGDIDLGGFDISNGGTITAANFVATGTITTTLGTAAGTFLAADPSGNIIATGTPDTLLTGASLTKGYFIVGDDSNQSQATGTIKISSTGNLIMNRHSLLAQITGLDTDTGLGFDGPDILSLHTGGTNRLYINAIGEVSIATTSTSDVLAIQGIGSSNIIEAYDSLGSSKFIVKSTGNVGIGTTSPGALFSVQGNGLFSGDISLSGLTAAGTLTVQGSATSTFAGALGVGTTTPANTGHKLIVQGSAAIYENKPATSSSMTLDLNTGNQQLIGLGAATTITLANGYIGGAYRLILCQDGTGSRVVTWGSAISWAGGTQPTLTTTANKCDVISLLRTQATTTPTFIGGASLNY